VIDVSDGLAADLGHVCDSSRVGVRIDAGTIPVSDAAAGVARAAGLDPFDWALAGGEDYELIFTAPGEQMERLIAAVLSTADTPVTVIGEIVEERWELEETGPGGLESLLTGAGQNRRSCESSPMTRSKSSPTSVSTGSDTGRICFWT
jgi:thiamine-monophosphate kinase